MLSATNTKSAQLAALDLGSNSFHLLIAQEDQGRIQVIDKYKEMVRLGEGLTTSNELKPEVAERALLCLERMSQRLRSVERENLRVVGTNTLRRLTSNSSFVVEAEAMLQHPIEIISGREEARLIYSGVCHDLGDNTNRQLVVDIGGGSTELIVGENYAAQTLESLNVGCVSITKKHFTPNRSLDEIFRNAIVDVLVELEPVAQTYLQAGWNQVVGASGTINSVMAVQTAMDIGTQITPCSLQRIREEILRLGGSHRLPGLAIERADVFAGGLAILIAVFQTFRIEAMEASQSALREGVILDLLGRKRDSDIRFRTVADVGKRFSVDQAQAQRVRHTAMTLFDQIEQQWGLNSRLQRHLLGWAADLHEIGMDISHNKYHKHGSYLLSHMDLPGFSRTEQAQLAALIGTHRRKLHPEVLEHNPKWVIELALLLRLAALLHRHRGAEATPRICITANNDAQSVGLKLAIDPDYLQEHSLTALDLANEVKLLAAIGIRFSVNDN